MMPTAELFVKIRYYFESVPFIGELMFVNTCRKRTTWQSI